MNAPLVTVICLCYNHARFVKEAIDSVLKQTHNAVQLVVVDDASTDNSVEVIRAALASYPDVPFLVMEKNLGNCRAFNKGFEFAKGAYIIDLAADDALRPDRIEVGLQAFERAGVRYGVHFSDATLLNAEGGHIRFHSEKFPHDTIPQGDIYKEVIGRYFINSPTMMIRRTVLETLDGYDETLAYEDFDFWVRASRHYFFCYTPEPLVRRRLLGNSMTRQQYKRNSPQLYSTFRVCEKIRNLNTSPDEDKALRKRIRYEAKKSFAVGEWGLVWRYLKLYFLI